jgi:hypothetical protein
VSNIITDALSRCDTNEPELAYSIWMPLFRLLDELRTEVATNSTLITLW